MKISMTKIFANLQEITKKETDWSFFANLFAQRSYIVLALAHYVQIS